ncbi:putative aminohydrolase SsnA [bacterium]|nr:putative aminohydrolase SsnA [bacterium]
MASLLIGPATVCTFGDRPRVLPDAGVAIEDGVIRDVGPYAKLSKSYRSHTAIRTRNSVILPGLICAHHHFYSTFARGLAPAKTPRNFVEVLKYMWWRLDRNLTLEDVYYSALIPLIECIKSGTTTVIDHHASAHAVRGSLGKIADAARVAGVRVNLCYEVSDRDGPAIAAEGIAENSEFLSLVSNPQSAISAGGGSASGGRNPKFLTASFGLHASFTLSDRTLREVSRRLESLDAGVHVHVAEDLADRKDALKKYRTGVVQRLAGLDLLRDKTILAHCIYITPAERRLIARKNCMVAHNPTSNMNNAVGTADLLGLTRDGVLVGLGTDGMRSSMLDEAKFAAFPHRMALRDPAAAFCETADLLVKGNPAIASRLFGSRLGVIEKGAAADLIRLDYHPPTPFTDETFYGHLLFGLANARVRDTMVGGRFLMRDGKLQIGVSEEEAAAAARVLAAKFRRRFAVDRRPGR